jgi:hypothetical protein
LRDERGIAGHVAHRHATADSWTRKRFWAARI